MTKLLARLKDSSIREMLVAVPFIIKKKEWTEVDDKNKQIRIYISGRDDVEIKDIGAEDPVYEDTNPIVEKAQIDDTETTKQKEAKKSKLWEEEQAKAEKAKVEKAKAEKAKVEEAKAEKVPKEPAPEEPTPETITTEEVDKMQIADTPSNESINEIITNESNAVEEKTIEDDSDDKI